jgi:hypothetical protein
MKESGNGECNKQKTEVKKNTKRWYKTNKQTNRDGI